MARVVLDIGDTPQLFAAIARWDESNGLGEVTALRASGVQSWLIRLQLQPGAVGFNHLYVSDSIPSPGTAGGDELSGAFELYAAALTLHNPHIPDDLVVPGPAHASNEMSDASEPYTWRSSAAVRTAISTYLGALIALTADERDDTQLTLDDGVVVDADAAGSAESGSPTASATAEAVDINRDAAGEAVSGSPTASATATADALLALADALIPDGRQLVGTASLIEIPADGDVYDSDATILAGADPPNLGAANLNPTRIYVTGNPQLRISQDGLGNIETTFAAGGAQEDYEIHVQTSPTDVLTYDSSDIHATRSTNARLLLGANGDPQGLLAPVSALAGGDRVLWFLTEPQTVANADAAATATTGSPEATATAEAVDINRDAAASAETGSPEATATATADDVSVVNRDASASAETGSPTASATAEAQSITNRDAAASAESGSPEASATAEADTPPTGPPYADGLRIIIAGVRVHPLLGSLRLRRSLVDGASLSFTLRGNASDYGHVVPGAEATVEDVGTGTGLFAGNVLRPRITGQSGVGDFVDLKVTAQGIQQRPFSRLLTSAHARAVNTATTVSDQLDELVAILGGTFSAGDVHANVNRLLGVGPGGSVGEVLRTFGDVQRINPDGSVDLIMREGLVSAAAIPAVGRVRPGSSRYSVDEDSVVGRIIAHGAPVRFIATGMVARITEDGVNRAVASVSAPAGTEVIEVSRVLARAALTGKFDAGDTLDGVWDPDRERFEWSGTLGATDTALVEMHGTWRTEEVVEASDPDPLAGDALIDVPSTSATDIANAADRALANRSQPVELMTLHLVLGAAVPMLVPGDAVTVAVALQRQLDVHLPDDGTLWLVHDVTLTQDAALQALVSLGLSRRLPDARDRDFWGAAAVPGSAGRQLVVGGGTGAPQTSQVIPSQEIRVGESVDYDLNDYFSDPDGDMLTYVAVSPDSSIVSTAVSGSTLTLTAVAEGSVSITVTGSDATRSVAQIFGVSAVSNRAPVLVQSLPDRTVMGSIVIDPLNFFSDPDGDHLDVTATSDDPTVATVAVSGTGAVTVTRAGVRGTANITVTASDGEFQVSDTFAASAAAPVTLDIGDTPQLFAAIARWDESNGLGEVTALRASGVQSWLIRLQLQPGAVGFNHLYVSDSIPSPGTAGGDELSGAFELYAAALTLHNPHIPDDLVVPGPAHASNEMSDASEPYTWRSSAAVRTAISTYLGALIALNADERDDTQLILDDGVV